MIKENKYFSDVMKKHFKKELLMTKKIITSKNTMISPNFVA